MVGRPVAVVFMLATSLLSFCDCDTYRLSTQRGLLHSHCYSLPLCTRCVRVLASPRAFVVTVPNALIIISDDDPSRVQRHGADDRPPAEHNNGRRPDHVSARQCFSAKPVFLFPPSSDSLLLIWLRFDAANCAWFYLPVLR